MEYLAGWLFLALSILLFTGFPVAFTLLGTSLVFGLIGFGWDFFNLLPIRIWGVMGNFTLVAVPLFVFMGLMLERSGMAGELLETMGMFFGKLRGGLTVSVILVGALLGASTGIVGATVVTMGLLALPTMLKWGYQKELATGTIAASGTLGQIIPPSIILVLLGDIIGVSVGDLFVGAVMPGLLLVVLYIVYVVVFARLNPNLAPAMTQDMSHLKDVEFIKKTLRSLVAPLILIVAVLGSIFAGIATPTEAAGVGAAVATLLCMVSGKLNFTITKEDLISLLNQPPIWTPVFPAGLGMRLNGA